MRLSFGCVLGVPLATASLRFLIHLAPVDVPRLTEAGVDIHAMHRKQATRQALQHCPQCASCTISRWPKLFSASLAFISGVLVGGLNALQVLRHSPREVLSNASRNTAGRQRTWLRSSLVVSQVALAIILVSGAGLMLRTFLNLLSTNTGYRSGGVLYGVTVLPPSQYPRTEQRELFFKKVLDRLRNVPGVEFAAVSTGFPFVGQYDEVKVDTPGLADGNQSSRLTPISKPSRRAISKPWACGLFAEGSLPKRIPQINQGGRHR